MCGFSNLLFFNSVEVGLGTENPSGTMYSRGSHEPAIELALGENLKLARGRDRGCLALLAKEKNPFTICHR
jgi:hypothetical protein